MYGLIARVAENFGGSLMASSDPVGEATNFAFFALIDDYVSNKIEQFQWELLGRTATWVGGVALVLLTLWILIQGFRVATGQSRMPMMALVGDSLKAVLIIAVATAAASASGSLFWSLTDGISTEISQVVAGTSSPLQSIDNNLAAMQGAMSLIDGLDAGGDATIAATKTQDKWFTGIGVAGPGVIAGSMLLLNKVALALFIGFGPLFILALLFPQTKSLFTKWLFYGIGTVFSLAVLSVMVSIASSMIGVVTAAFAAKYATLQALSALGLSNATASEGINSMAMQQGGLGLILSALIISAPPMAAAFFQGMLGQFQSFSSFGSIGASGAAGAAAQQQRMLGNPAATLPPPDPARLGGATVNQPTNTSAFRTPSVTNTNTANEQIPQRQTPSSPSGGQ
jgi:type IV secretion system protein VirB6